MSISSSISPSFPTPLEALAAFSDIPPHELASLLVFMTASEKAELGALMRFSTPGEYVPASADDLPIPELGMYADNPKGFLVDILGVQHWYPEIEEVCLSLVQNRITDVPAGHGVGKTFYVGRLVVWWIFARGGSFVTTAPGLRQVRRLLWKEIRRAHAKIQARFGKQRTGRCDATQLVITPWHYGYGFAAPEWNPDAALGEHDAKLLVVVDEANAIGPAIWDSLNSLTTGSENRRLNLSNPTAPDTPFHKSCRQSQVPGEHKTIKIPVWSHPNLTSKGRVSLVPGAVDSTWVESVRTNYTELSSYWKSRVEAEFPDESDAALVPRAAFEAAIRRFSPTQHIDSSNSIPFSFGMDVGENRDRTVFTGISRMCLSHISSFAPVADDRDIARGVGYAKNLLRIAPAGSSMCVDGHGVGAGVAAVLLDEDYTVQSIKVGAKSSDTEEFKLTRDELAWKVRLLFMRGMIAVRPPRTHEEKVYLEALKDDLASMRWDRDSRGRFQLWKKVKIKALLGRSPDFGDSLMLCVVNIELPDGMTEMIVPGFEGVSPWAG